MTCNISGRISVDHVSNPAQPSLEDIRVNLPQQKFYKILYRKPALAILYTQVLHTQFGLCPPLVLDPPLLGLSVKIIETCSQIRWTRPAPLRGFIITTRKMPECPNAPSPLCWGTLIALVATQVRAAGLIARRNIMALLGQYFYLWLIIKWSRLLHMVKNWKMRPVCHICGKSVQSMIYVSSYVFHRSYCKSKEGINLGILWLQV
jgi:hypothetical protein